MHAKWLGFAFFAMLVSLLALPAQAGEPVLRELKVLPGDEETYQCMAASQFVIGGITLGDPLDKLGRVLGVPRTLTSGYGEDDGGGYRAYGYDYGGLKVEIVREKVDIIHAYGARFATPAGLRVGLPREDVYAILGREPDPGNLHEGWYSFSGCPENRDGQLVWYDNWYFEFTFGADSRLTGIRLVADRP